MNTARRPISLVTRLAKLGFDDPARAERFLADPTLSALTDPFDDVFHDGVLAAFAEVADPDLALTGLVRMLEGLPTSGTRSAGRLLAMVRSGGLARTRLLAVLGSSAALADHLARHPEHWEVLEAPTPGLADPPNPTAEEVRETLVAAVQGLDLEAGSDALRVAYFRRLLAIAARDLTAADPVGELPSVAADLADLASAALEAALAIARAHVALTDPVALTTRLVVLGMGKCGGHELNYISDVDVIYVVEPGPTAPGEPEDPDAEQAALKAGTKMAAALARICSANTAEGSLWEVDANLRPEGKQGPLVRTMASHLAYYHRWAATWEFQALLKARPVAGDLALGEEYLEQIWPLVWRAAERENFVEDVQAMRRRVEQNVPARDGDRQLKLGPGGLRDVEFSVQLLQLVHGRVDPRLRTGNTVQGLEILSAHGYVGRDDAAELDRAYRFLRVLEHRIQLFKLKRTHVVPESPSDLRRIGRSLGMRGDAAAELVATWRRHGREVRRLHEKLFYRPLLSAAARLSTDEVRLTPEAAVARLSALGYRNPDAAMRHLGALTSGVSRRAAIQRQILSVMLGWFANGADPDAGLLAFRKVSEGLGTTHWYLRMLRDSGAAAERLAQVLSSSQLVAQWVERAPETVAFFSDDAELTPRPASAVISSGQRAASRHEDPDAAALAARGVRRRELVRTAIADVVGLIDHEAVGQALSAAATAALAGGLEAAIRTVARRNGTDGLPTRIAVIGMGRLGGGELGYGSDADILVVHDPLPGADEEQAQRAATEVVEVWRRILGKSGAEPRLEVDAGLRPEGRNGPLVRSLASYAEYYRRWSLPWEAQALTRAAPVAGDAELGAAFVELIEPLRWPGEGLDEAGVREIRRIKARVEAERLPRGADPKLHLKLGRGGLSDVEWTVQLFQLQHAGKLPELRTPSTLQGLRAATQAGLIEAEDAEILEAAWVMASRLRNATVLWRGRPADSLPTNVQDLDGIARITGYPPGSASEMLEEYHRTTRRARAVVERVFYA